MSQSYSFMVTAKVITEKERDKCLKALKAFRPNTRTKLMTYFNQSFSNQMLFITSPSQETGLMTLR